MTIIDLNEVRQPNQQAMCDVCIVGAGAAGLYLADRLSRQGRTVVVVEAGGRKCTSGASIGIEPILADTCYAGTTEGRSFGLGGTTSRWGGVLIPYTESDYRPNERFSDAWRHILKVVDERSKTVAARLGVAGDDFVVAAEKLLVSGLIGRLRDQGIQTLASECLPFRKRNLTHLVTGMWPRATSLTVYLNAVVTLWKVQERHGKARLTSSVAKSRSGRHLSVAGKCFVIAAGAFETARILLEIDRLHGQRVFPPRSAIGRYLSDHLSCPIANVPEEDWERTVRLFAPRFVSGRMRRIRFVEAPTTRDVPRYFAHFIFDINSIAFSMIKEILWSLQAKKMPKLIVPNVAHAVREACLFAYHRYVKTSLFIPPKTPVHLHLDIEQEPRADNAVYLGDETDEYGRPVAIVRWRWADEDYENINSMAQRFLQRWPAPSQGLPRLERIRSGLGDVKPYNAYHPVGTARLGVDEESVVDMNLRVRGTENLFVLSTAVFPSAGTANPTFSMLCLGDALADKLDQELRVGSI